MRKGTPWDCPKISLDEDEETMRHHDNEDGAAIIQRSPAREDAPDSSQPVGHHEDATIHKMSSFDKEAIEENREDTTTAISPLLNDGSNENQEEETAAPSAAAAEDLAPK